MTAPTSARASAPALPADTTATTRRSALATLAGVGAALVVPKAARAAFIPIADPIPPLYIEARAIVDRINHRGEIPEECEAGADRLDQIDQLAIGAQATTIPGAIASLEWARSEFVDYFYENNQGGRLVLALLDGALGVLRNGGAS